jgi:tellurite resistance protein TehA-like permease
LINERSGGVALFQIVIICLCFLVVVEEHNAAISFHAATFGGIQLSLENVRVVVVVGVVILVVIIVIVVIIDVDAFAIYE